MRIGLVTIAYREARFMPKFLSHIPSWITETLVLSSVKPWQGEDEPDDGTAELARRAGATVVEYDWRTEHDQRNAGQDYFHDMDWIITLDPDEYLTHKGWANLKEFLLNAHMDSYVCQSQYTYWKSRLRVDPQEDYKQIILVRPGVRFTDKRCVNTNWGYAPVVLHHLSWARTNAECLSKISHYSHGHELNSKWYKDVWLAGKKKNLHPLTPESLSKVIPADLPKELEELQLWPDSI